MIEKLAVKQPRLVNNSASLLLHDNARPHTAQQTPTKLEEVQLECLRHPPYCPDLAPTV
jgi:transposase